MKNILFTLILLFVTTFVYSQSCTYCEGDTPPTLTASTSGGVGAVTYTWTSPSAVQTAGATVAASEAGTWTWTGTDTNNCVATGTFDVIIVNEPTVAIVASNACVGESQTISATGVPGGATYAWDFGVDAVPATSATATTSVYWSSGVTKTITLAVTTNGCTFNYSTTVDVSDISGSASCGI